MKEGIQKLRAMTGCGILDCKKALTECEGNIEEAVIWLRKNGMTKAAKKMGRDSHEGVVAVVTDGTWGALVKVATETDFVARNETFQAFVGKLLTVIKTERPTSLETLTTLSFAEGKTVGEEITHMVAVIGESVKLEAFEVIEVPSGLVASYIHNAYTPSLGRIGVIVGIESDSSANDLAELGEHLAMHVAASKPVALDCDQIDSTQVAQEKALFLEEAKTSGKPEMAWEKIVEGRLKKFYAENVFLEQPFIMDGKKSVAQVLEEQSSPVTLTGYNLMMVG